jgi:hypothetical protein
MLDATPWNAVAFVVSTMCAWRVTHLLTQEDGPHGSFARARRLLSTIGAAPIISCFHCTAVWISLGVVLIVYRVGLEVLPLTFAVAGAVSTLQRILGALSDWRNHTDPKVSADRGH